MTSILKMLFSLLRGLVYEEFDDKGIKRSRFNGFRFITLTVFILSVLLNLWLLSRYVVLSKALFKLNETVAITCPEAAKPPVVKNP